MKSARKRDCGVSYSSSGVPCCAIPPAVHHDDVVGHRERFLLVVRHVQHRQRQRLLQLADLLADPPPQLGVEVRQRLVEQQHRGLQHQRPRDGDALLLAAGEFGRQPRLVLRQAQHLQLLARHSPRLLLVGAHRQRSVADVFQHRHVREQRIRLEHHADVALVGRAQRHVLAADQHAPARHRFESGNHPQRRRLAAARGAEQRDEFALRDLERHVVDGGHVAVFLGDAFEDDAACGIAHIGGASMPLTPALSPRAGRGCPIGRVRGSMFHVSFPLPLRARPPAGRAWFRRPASASRAARRASRRSARRSTRWRADTRRPRPG